MKAEGLFVICGGASLAVAEYLKQIMLRKNIKGSFALGGITGYIVGMLEAGFGPCGG